MRILPGMVIPRRNPNPPDPYYADAFDKEAKWQRNVELTFRGADWETYHTWGSMHSPDGFPDLVAVHPFTGRTIHAELKTETGVVAEKQAYWLGIIALRGEAYLWRPSDASEIAAIVEEEFAAAIAVRRTA